MTGCSIKSESSRQQLCTVGGIFKKSHLSVSHFTDYHGFHLQQPYIGRNFARGFGKKPSFPGVGVGKGVSVRGGVRYKAEAFQVQLVPGALDSGWGAL